jgi:adenosylcobinamide-GDP ribazoletransferase
MTNIIPMSRRERESRPRDRPVTDAERGVPGPTNDNTPRPDPGARLRDDLVMGVRFYSRLPVPGLPHEVPDLGRMAPLLPLVSAILGALPAVVLVVGIWLGLPSVYAAGLAVALGLLITGAMAEDALADAFDGLFGSAIPERRLEIMRDSRHGTYGVAALCLLLLLKVLAIGAIAAVHPLAGAGAWLAAAILARSTALYLPVALPPARLDGASAAAGRVSRPAFAFGALIAAIATLVLAGPATGIIGVTLALILAAAVAIGWTLLCRRLVNGQTGDLIGALQALVEIAALTVFLAIV